MLLRLVNGTTMPKLTALATAVALVLTPVLGSVPAQAQEAKGR